jgi:hypothetical protein
MSFNPEHIISPPPWAGVFESAETKWVKVLDAKAAEIIVENASSKEIEGPRSRSGKPHAPGNPADDGPIFDSAVR